MALAVKQKLIRVADVKFAPWNPTNRTDEDNPALLRLAGSMQTHGLIYPILVRPNNDLIDGHRRVAAAKVLGWEEIAAIVSEGDREATYAAVNDCQAKMSGHDALGVWLANPNAVGPRTGDLCKQMADAIGIDLTKRFYAEGLGPWAYKTAHRLAYYCGDESGDLVVQIARWMLHTRQVGPVRKLIGAGANPKILLKAIKDMKPLKIQAAIE